LAWWKGFEGFLLGDALAMTLSVGLFFGRLRSKTPIRATHTIIAPTVRTQCVLLPLLGLLYLLYRWTSDGEFWTSRYAWAVSLVALWVAVLLCHRWVFGKDGTSMATALAGVEQRKSARAVAGENDGAMP
jgi:hypothetical protein